MIDFFQYLAPFATILSFIGFAAIFAGLFLQKNHPWSIACLNVAMFPVFVLAAFAYAGVAYFSDSYFANSYDPFTTAIRSIPVFMWTMTSILSIFTARMQFRTAGIVAKMKTQEELRERLK